MSVVETEVNNKGQGNFYILEGDERIAFMEMSRSGDVLIVPHTEVMPKAEGNGLAKELFNEMITFARKNNLKVLPLCPYVHAQFKRHPAEFEDIWKH